MKSVSLLSVPRRHVLGAFLLIGLLVLAGCTPVVPQESWPGIAVNGNLTPGGAGVYQDGQYVYAVYRNTIFRVDTTRAANGRKVSTDQPAVDRLIDWAATSPSNALMFANPVIGADGTIYVGAYNHSIYAFSPNASPRNAVISGFQAPSGTDRVIADGLIYNNLLYVGQGDKGIKSYDLKTGAKQAEYTGTRFGVWAAPAVDTAAGVLYVASMDQHIYTLDARDLSYIAEVEVGGAVASTPLLAPDGLLYVGTFNSELLVIDPKAEKRGQAPEILVRFKTEGWVWSTPVWKDGTLFFGDMKGNVYSLDVSRAKEKSVTQKWRANDPDRPGGIRGRVAVANGQVVAANENKYVRSYDEKTGNPNWTGGPISERIMGDVVIIGNEAVVTTMSENELVVAFDLDKGYRKWAVGKPNQDKVNSLAQPPALP